VSKVINEFDSIINMLEQAKLDIYKGVSGNRTAAKRARQQLRSAQGGVKRLIKFSLQESKSFGPGRCPHHFGPGVMTCFESK